MRLTLKTTVFVLLLGTFSLSSTSYADENLGGPTEGGIVMDRSLHSTMWVQVLDQNGDEVLLTTLDNNIAIESLPQGSYTLNYLDVNGEVKESVDFEI